MLIPNANIAANSFYENGQEIDVASAENVLDVSKSPWLTDIEIHPSYIEDNDAERVEMIREKFQSQLPNFDAVVQNLCSNLFLAFILFLPTDFVFSIFSHSNYHVESKWLSFWDIVSIFLFWVERRGFVSIYGPINQQSDKGKD